MKQFFALLLTFGFLSLNGGNNNEVMLIFNPGENHIILKFHNPEYQSHQLSIFTEKGKKLKTMKNLQTDFVKINKQLISDCNCSYVLKSENGNYFVGKLNL